VLSTALQSLQSGTIHTQDAKALAVLNCRLSESMTEFDIKKLPTIHFSIFIVDAQGGAPHQLTNEPSSEGVPSWSRDGHWIYFASDRTGRYQVWKMASKGRPAVQVTHRGGFAAIESPNGRFVYYAKG